MMVNIIIFFTKAKLSNEKRIKMRQHFLVKKRNILKIYIVNFVYFNNIYLIKLSEIIITATNALKV